MPAPISLDPNGSILAYWGAELRRLRTEAGMTQRELGERTCYSTSYIGHVETAKRHPSRDFAQKSDKVFNTDTLTRLWALISKDAYPSWFRPYLEIEREARTIKNWEPVLVPGLLQTPDYARALVRATNPRWTSQQVEEVVDSRISRQEILDREDPPTFLAFLDEGVLHRLIGSTAVMRAQLEHLMELAETQQHTSVQIVPLDAGAHAGLTGSIVVASFKNQPDVVYLESLWKGEVVTEPDGIEALTSQMDAIRVLALPQAASLSVIRKALEQWT
jgi:transcriptional regulator with XRE-family HTH domain